MEHCWSEVATVAETGTQALDRALAIVRLVVRADDSLTYTDVVERTDLARSTVSRLLGALERGGLLERDDAGGFRGGPLFAEYATTYDRVTHLVQAAHPFLEAVATATGETVNLAVVRQGRVRHVDQIDAQYVVGAANWVSVDVPGHCSALGKVLYAASVLPFPRGHLERRTEQSIATRGELQEVLEEVRAQGWAETHGELEDGLDAVAAPVRGAGGEVVAALGVSGPTYRLRDRHEDVAQVLVRETSRLSRELARRNRR